MKRATVFGQLIGADRYEDIVRCALVSKDVGIRQAVELLKTQEPSREFILASVKAT